MSCIRNHSISRGLWFLGLVLGSGLLLSQDLRATPQTASQSGSRRPTPKASMPPSRATQPPRFKGIWEPVNYNQDLNLNDVFFVSDDEGWVSGEHGTILHTKDGGRTWTAQLGGDPQGAERDIFDLRFLDARHGWAAQSTNLGGPLLRTVDGETWRQVGVIGDAIVPYKDYVFTSPTTGVYVQPGRIRQTLDGGRTWRDVLSPCVVRLQIQGLAQEMTCNLTSLHFPSPRVGYAVGATGSALVIAKTVDGGATWTVTATPDAYTHPNEPFFPQRIFFLDDNTGFARFSSGKTLMTTDGGQSWQEWIATSGRMKFADPEVGWSWEGDKWSYTPDGGKHWFSRNVNFPTSATAFSLPSRRRAYVVGIHGMIYRYRVVPATYQAVAHSFDGPAMPGIDSPVPGEVATMNDVVAKLRLQLPAPAAGQSGGTQPQWTEQGGVVGPVSSLIPSGSGTSGAGGFQQDVGTGPVAGGYMDSCCGLLIQQLETTAGSFGTNVPTYSQRFRNLNLIFQGLNFLNSVVNQANTLKQSIRALRQAKNAQTAAVALNAVQTQVSGISSSGGFVQDTTMPSQQ